jgi:pre-mRNA branch site protein p14
MYDIFGKYGAIRQIRVGNAPETKGTAFIVYEDIHDAKAACEHLSGFNVGGRYLVVLYYQPHRAARQSRAQTEAEVAVLRLRVAAGESAAAAAAAAAPGDEDDTTTSLDDEHDKRMLGRVR